MIPMPPPAIRPPAIHARDEWHAEPPRRELAHKPERIVLHHSWRPTARDWRGGDTVRAIQQYHMHDSSTGWDDIGYHYLIGPDGSTWAGRGPLTIGAHCGGRLPDGVRRVFGNKGSIGICLIGDFDREEPTLDAIASLVALINWLQREHGLRRDAIYGHCEAWSRAPKSCPGRHLFFEILGEARWAKIRW